MKTIYPCGTSFEYSDPFDKVEPTSSFQAYWEYEKAFEEIENRQFDQWAEAVWL